MRVRLINRSISHNNLRTDSVDGEALGAPITGSPFIMFAEALEHKNHPGAFRQITTSIVQSVERISGGWEFQTLNSKYEVTLL